MVLHFIMNMKALLKLPELEIKFRCLQSRRTYTVYWAKPLHI